MTPLRILIVDDHHLTRHGIRALLQNDPGFEIAGEAETGRQAVEQAVALRPHVVLMDVRLPDMDGIEATRLIREQVPEARVLMLTIHDDRETVLRALCAGAEGYVLKDIPPDRLAEAIRAVANGQAVINAAVVRRLAEAATQTVEQSVREAVGKEGLSEREIDVLIKVAQGLSDREIARQLFLSEATVKTHLRSVYRKLGLRNRVQAAAYAVGKGLVS